MMKNKYHAKVNKSNDESEYPTVTKLPAGTTFEYEGVLYIKLNRDGQIIPYTLSGSFAVCVESGNIIHLASATNVKICDTDVDYRVLPLSEYHN